MRKKRIAFERPPYNNQYLLTHPWEIVGYYWKELKWFFQRGLYGYSDTDLWSLDWYLCQWLPTAIRHYKKGMVYPGLGKVKTMRDWQKILETMAKGFEAQEKMQDSEWFSKNDSKVENDKRYKKLDESWQQGMKFFTKYFGCLWD